MDKKEPVDDQELEAGISQGGGGSSRQPDGDSSDSTSPGSEEDFPSDSYQSTQGALLGATLRANVFNPEFLPTLSGQQMASPSDDDVAAEQFPTLLSASLRSNVFNSDFLDLVVERHVQDRAEAHVQARGLESHASLARKVTSRAPAIIDVAIAQALNEELATTIPDTKRRGSYDNHPVEDPSLRSSGVEPSTPVVIDLTVNGQAGEPSDEQNRKTKQAEVPRHEKLPALKRVWRKFLQPHSQLAAQLEALVTLAVLAGVLLCCLWLAIGHAAAPDGAVFSLVVVYLAAVVFGELAARVGTHPLVGMLIAGFICRYVPGVKAGRVIPHEVSAFIREFGLCTILLRAGIALDVKLLMRLKWLSFACSVFPTVVEAAVLAAMSVWLFSLPWTWGFMTGFIVAGVAPAIVVPALLALQDEGFGVAKGIPSLVLAVAAVDDCLSVIGNAVFNNIIFSKSELVMSIFRAPIEIAMGIAIGVGLGFGAILLLPRSRPPGGISRQDSLLKRRASQHRTENGNSVHRRQKTSISSPPLASPTDAASNPGSDAETGSTKVLKAIKDKIQPQKMLPPLPPGDGVKMALMRTAYVLGFGLWCIMGGQKIKYSGAGALAVVLLGAVAGQGWGRDLSSKPKLYLLYTWGLLAQPLLFGVIGSQIDVSYFKGSFLWRGVIILPVAAIARAIVTVGSTVGTALNMSERLFLALAWLPKATVQAALAPQALSQVAGKNDPKLRGYAETVFAIGMLSVILTAPLGAMFLKLSGPRLLEKADKRPEQVMHAE